VRALDADREYFYRFRALGRISPAAAGIANATGTMTGEDHGDHRRPRDAGARTSASYAVEAGTSTLVSA
jgi:hypothetical protein